MALLLTIRQDLCARVHGFKPKIIIEAKHPAAQIHFVHLFLTLTQAENVFKGGSFIAPHRRLPDLNGRGMFLSRSKEDDPKDDIRDRPNHNAHGQQNNHHKTCPARNGNVAIGFQKAIKAIGQP